MNKLTKGALAVGAGAVLLLGSAGSLAYWQATVHTSALQVQTGSLGMTAGAETYALNGVAVDSTQVSALRLVPGDVFVYTRQIAVETVGTDLTAALDVALGGLTAVAHDNPGVDRSAGFSGKVVPTYSVEAVSGSLAVVPTTTDNSYNVSGTGDVRITITLAWPFGTASSDSTSAGDDTTLADLNLGLSTITLRQVPEALPIEEN